MPAQSLFDLHYAGWANYQLELAQAIAPLTDEQLSLTVAPPLRSVMTLAAHIIAARVWWFHHVMGEGPAELAPMVRWDDEGEPARSADELVAGLESTWVMIKECLGRWTTDDLAPEFSRPGDETGRRFSHKWIVWHVLEHDMHHGGELSFVLGAHGLPAITL